MNRVVSILRSAATLLLFAIFGAGALPFSLLLVFVRNRGVAQRYVRGIWTPFMKLMAFFRLLSIDCRVPENIRGAVIVANHPSLLDVLVILVSIPRTFFIAKDSLRNNPFCMMSVRRVSFPNDARLLEEAPKWLAAGWNVLIFPEGTRSPSSVKMNEFKRGAAQLALRSKAPICVCTINYSRDLLNKRHPFWDVGEEEVVCRVRLAAKREPSNADTYPGELHNAAKMLTGEMRQIILNAIENSYARVS